MPKMRKPRVRILEIGGLPDAILGIPGLAVQDFSVHTWIDKIRRAADISEDDREGVINSIMDDGFDIRLLDPDGSAIEAGPEAGRTWIRQGDDGELYVWKTANPDVGEPYFPAENEDK